MFHNIYLHRLHMNVRLRPSVRVMGHTVRREMCVILESVHLKIQIEVKVKI